MKVWGELEKEIRFRLCRVCTAEGRFALNDQAKTRVRERVIDFLCAAMGGPCKYNGRDMKTSHAGLNITAEDWKTNVKYLVATLDKFKVREKEKRGFKRGGSLKDDIVGR